MATRLSEFGQLGNLDAVVATTVNSQLAYALVGQRPLSLSGVDLELDMIHMGTGEYLTGARAATHEHAELQIEYGLSGAFHFDTHGGSVDLLPGSALLAPPAVPHRWVCEATGVMIGALLRVKGPRAVAFIQSLQRQATDRLVVVDTPAQRQMLWELWQTLREAPGRPWRDERLAALLRLLVLHTVGAGFDLSKWLEPRTAAQAEGCRDDLVCQRAMDFMAANYGRAISLPDIALQAGVSVRHLSRLFQQRRRVTVNRALASLRLERAQALLGQGTQSVKEVAFACGFSSPAYFTQCYRRHYGCVPSAESIR